MTEGNISNRYSLNCVQYISPLCCDRPDEYLDVETVDVVPPFPDDPYDSHRVDAEDTEFDDELNDAGSPRNSVRWTQSPRKARE